MPKTLYGQTIPTIATVVVHSNVSPTDEDWEEVMQMILDHGATTKNLLVYSAEAGPTANQRARFAAVLREVGDLKTVVMSNSRMVRGTITAFGWTMAGKVAAASADDFDAAIAKFDLSEDDALRVRVLLKQLARSADQSVQAFANESGRFHKKFGE